MENPIFSGFLYNVGCLKRKGQVCNEYKKMENEAPVYEVICIRTWVLCLLYKWGERVKFAYGKLSLSGDK